MGSAQSTPVRLLRAARPVTAVRRLDELIRRVPIPLALVLAAAVALRVLVMIVYQPAVVRIADTPTYVQMADGGLFGDPVRPSGYPMLLIVLHAISDKLAFTLAVQHLLGIATGLLLYGIARRLGASVWVGTVAAAAVLLPLDQVVLEHVILSEAAFTFVLMLALYSSVRALEAPRSLVGPLDTRLLWILGAGLTLGFAGWVRGVAVPMIAFLALWLALAIPGTPWRRIGRGALAGGTAVALLLVYFALNEARTGTFGLTRSSGWAMYSRVAPFADCSQFEPPAGTERLCENSPPAARYGPDFYGWEEESPAHKLFYYPPLGDQQLGAFAREVIVHQPRAYANAVGTDILRYFLPDYRTYPFGGQGYEGLDIGHHSWALELEISGYLGTYYDSGGLDFDEDVLRVLSEVQDWVRVHPPLLLAALLFGMVGIVLSSGRTRATLVLLCGAALLLLVIPPVTSTYSARYAIPANGPLITAGALGAWLLLGRLRER